MNIFIKLIERIFMFKHMELNYSFDSCYVIYNPRNVFVLIRANLFAFKLIEFSLIIRQT